MESRIRGNMYVRFGGGFLETCYSNIVRRWVSILRLRAQYIWYLGLGILVLLILFGAMYALGVPSFICIGLVLIAGTTLVMKVYAMSAKYGEHGLTKEMAKRNIPKVVRCNSRRIFIKLKK